MADRSKLVHLVCSIHEETISSQKILGRFEIVSIHEVTISSQKILGRFEIVFSFRQISFCLRTNLVRKLYNTINLLMFNVFWNA